MTSSTVDAAFQAAVCAHSEGVQSRPNPKWPFRARPRPRALSPQEAVAGYKRCDVVLGRVVHVEETLAVVEIFPRFQVTVDWELMHVPQADLTHALVVGETLSFIVLQRGDTEDDWTLARAEDRHGKAIPAPPLRQGGAPWLSHDLPTMPRRTAYRAPEPKQQAGAEVRAAATKDREDLQRARTEVRRLRAQVATLKAAQEKGQAALDLLQADKNRYSRPAEQFRFEVELSYARRTTADEKDDLALRPWTLGPEFLHSLQATPGVDRQKVIDVVVDLLLGRADQAYGRQVHAVRVERGGNSSALTRSDGSTCWRMAIPHLARRLHYWTTPNGQIELSSVRPHDDMRP